MGDKTGKLSTNAIREAKKDGDRQCPADLSPVIHSRIDDMVKKAHRTLKCRHYSLYDIRIDANEQPFILEAALFCSFSPLSVIPAMAQHAGRDDLKHPKLFYSFLDRAAAEKDAQRSSACKLAADLATPATTADTLQVMSEGTSGEGSDDDTLTASEGSNDEA